MMQDDNEMKEVCGFCGGEATKKCSACRQISYCTKEHQKQDWKKHKSSCKPFVVQKDDIKGRCLVAARDIKANEQLLHEHPLIIGPKFVSPEPVCVGCLKPIMSVSSTPKCPRCRWPVCDIKCKGIVQEHRLECDILAAENRRARKVYRYELITPLRCLLQKKHNPQKWETIAQMEAHLGQRTPDTDVYREVQDCYQYLKTNVLQYIKDYDEISEAMFHRVCGIVDVNGVEVPHESTELIALYPIFSLTEHNCSPNVKISFNKFQIQVKSAKPISKGGCISTSYTNILWGTQIRQQHLQSTKYFTCTCPRCEDPTEFGTHFSSIKCLQDNCNGYFLPKNPLNLDTLWECNNCSTKMPSNDISDIVLRMTHEVDQILAKKHPAVQNVEALLQKLMSVLHPHHYNCFSLKHSLIQLYGHELGFQYSNMGADLLNKKIDYCRELGSILSKLDSSGCRTPFYIAVVKYELSAALLETMRRTFLETINLSLIQEDSKEAKRLLVEAVVLLNDEKDNDISVQLNQSCKNLYKEIDEITTGQYYTDF